MDILIVDDDATIRQATLAAVEDEDHYGETASDGASALQRLKEEHFDLVLLDLQLGEDDGLEILVKIREKYPKVAVVIFTAHASIKTAIEAMRRGALEYLQKPFTPDELRRILVLSQRFSKMEKRIVQLETAVEQSSTANPKCEFESRDASMQQVFEVLFRAADTPTTILILGESGTGKSVAAKAVHERSGVAKKPFVTVSCPSLSKELLESELFGHMKGAFTGAVKDQWGKVKAAQGGTLFLDEIGELPMEIQPKLLRLLQEREYERLGENKIRKSDVRIIAATNRDLKEQVEKGEFREDLYYRLNVIAVEMPPLRARPGDLEHFASSYLEFFVNQFGRSIRGLSAPALKAILGYNWPGNLRELRNAIERAAILAKGDEIAAVDLPSSVLHGESADGAAAAVGSLVSLDELEREHIRLVVASAKNLTEAAEVLGIDQATLYRKRKKFDME